jgi:GxxExxY protein
MMHARYEEICKAVLDAAFRVHRELGPGLLESAYEACLVNDLVEQGYQVERQKHLPVRYRGLKIDCGYRIDLLIDGLVIVEVKSVAQALPIHTAQTITYLRLSGCKVALLINFNVQLLKTGIRRLLNGDPEVLSSCSS